MYQEGLYGEYCIHRRNTTGGLIARFLLIALLIIGVLSMLVCLAMSAMALFVIAFIFTAIDFFVILYMYPRFSVDWEYVFVDGQLDFDQILGGNARKTKDRIDFEQTEAVAPTGSHHLDQFKNMNKKVLNYSSLNGNPTYSLIGHKKELLVEIIFEPDENMVQLMKQKSPRKVFMD